MKKWCQFYDKVGEKSKNKIKKTKLAAIESDANNNTYSINALNNNLISIFEVYTAKSNVAPFTWSE